MSSQSDVFRLTLMSLGCLGLLYAMMVVFQSNDRPWLDGARMWLPFLVATVPPYLIILWRLAGRPADPVGLGLAIGCGVLAVVLLVAFVVNMATVKEQPALNLFVGLLFWHLTLLTAFVVFAPLQIKLVATAFSTLASSGASRAASTIGLGILFTMVYVGVARGFVGPLAEGTSESARRSEYSESTASKHLFKLYTCLWRDAGSGAANGFPASEEELRARGAECWDPATAPGGTAYGTHYEFKYFPGAPEADGKIRSFAIATKKRNAPGSWTDSRYLDHLGVLRRSVERWATAETDRIESFKHGIIPELMGLLDAYHDAHGAYPVRLLHPSKRDSAGPHDLVMQQGMLSARGTDTVGDTTVVDSYFGRLVYTPHLGTTDGPASTYTASLRSEWDGIHNLRSYFVDADGRIHGTGENRDATAADPEAPAIEWPPGARASARTRAAMVFAEARSSR
jgi:hypothetical protein